MFESGRGVERDRGRASDLYPAACTAGSKQACEGARAMRSPPVPPSLGGGLP